MCGLYQALSLTLTPFYQSDSRWLPVLRDILVPIATTVPPLPQFLAALVAGRLLDPLQATGAGAGSALTVTSAIRGTCENAASAHGSHAHFRVASSAIADILPFQCSDGSDPTVIQFA